MPMASPIYFILFYKASINFSMLLHLNVNWVYQTNKTIPRVETISNVKI